mgnify:CR=1 FL=1
MIKIIFIIDSLKSGGAERVMCVLANEFTAIGYYISIISKVKEGPFYKLDDKVRLIYPAKKIRYKNGIVKLYSRLRVYREIFKTLKNEMPDLIISFSTTTNGTSIIICKLLRLPIIACEHNNYKTNIKSLLIWFIKRCIYPFANILTVLTERDRNEYYGKYMRNVVVMPNPLPIEPAEKVSFTNRDRVILAVGNVSRWEQKGFDNLLKMFYLIVKKYPDWKLEIAGGGDPTYLLTMVEKLCLKNHVILLGEIRDIQILMQKSSIFVLPSRWEGLPMVLIEAMSQGMACVAFNCFTGPGDIIGNWEDGVLVKDQNNEDFVKKLSVIIDDKELRVKLGKNAIETSKRYGLDKIVPRWKDLIEHSIN